MPLVLHFFVKTDFYDGWVNVNDIALTDKTTWQKYSNPEDFLMEEKLEEKKRT